MSTGLIYNLSNLFLRLYWLRIIVRVLLLGGLILFFYFLMDVLESVQKFDLHIDDLPIRL